MPEQSSTKGLFICDLQHAIVERLALAQTPVHGSELRRQIGADPIEFGFALADLVDAGTIERDPANAFLPRYWLAGLEHA